MPVLPSSLAASSLAPSSLAELRDIHLPQSVAWWPLAPGWWFLLGMVLLLIGTVWWWFRRYKKQRWQRDALVQLHKELEQLRLHYQETHHGPTACATLSSLMRRVALQVFPDSSIAGIHGDQWLKFMDEKKLIGKRFSGSEWGTMLLNAPFSLAKVDPEQLIAYGQAWMEAAIQTSVHDNPSLSKGRDSR